MGTARIGPPADRYVDRPLLGGTYQSVSRSVRKPPSIGQYHRLRLFSPRYHLNSIEVDFNHRRSISGGINRWTTKKREKKRENLEPGAALPIPI
ncbi:hypothetical protein B296_00052562, partial [Ensete ventricosum]